MRLDLIQNGSTPTIPFKDSHSSLYKQCSLANQNLDLGFSLSILYLKFLLFHFYFSGEEKSVKFVAFFEESSRSKLNRQKKMMPSISVCRIKLTYF